MCHQSKLHYSPTPLPCSPVNHPIQCLHAQQEHSVAVQVPPGTVVKLKGDVEGKALAEVLQDGDRALLMVGGRGGRGNASFKSQRNK